MKKLFDDGLTKLATLFIILAVVLAAGAGFYAYNNQTQRQTATEPTISDEQKQQDETAESLQAGDFGEEGDYGTFEAEGYVFTETKTEAFCEEDCEEYEYVFFYIARTPNENVAGYIEKQQGNAYVSENAIGLGCLTDNALRYFNLSEANGDKEYTVSAADTAAITDSSTESQVAVRFTRLAPPAASGSEAPTCYSHFTTYKPINNG